MITIRILNAREIVQKERGFFTASLGSIFRRLEKEVEKEVVRQLAEVFQSKGIEAHIQITDDSSNTF